MVPMLKLVTSSPLGISLWQQPNPSQLVVKFIAKAAKHVGIHPPISPIAVVDKIARSSQPTTVTLFAVSEKEYGEDLDAIAIVAYVGLWRVGTSVAGDVEPWADGAIRPYAEWVRDCYVSAFEWAAGLGDEEAGVGYSGDVGSCVCRSCGLSS
ncbi:hypothetical protein Vadar_021724 [Vaccinium darrowii]|uniref:Uncharacterized protein n=1 Tax=Vaccinium darrowii TaxID=229202 RepID=A0ACB7X2S7_9ERIC|nr:hypothetical protein Vadar_021724 [Vaccinium darrowii]